MLAEKIYLLRKKSGLSQEQLASELNVSRQSVSKWETGASVPENEKLIALSEYFRVSVDYLIKDEKTGEPVREQPPVKNEAAPVSGKKRLIGLIVGIAGIAGLLIWGIVFLFNPAVSDRISGSSVIRIDGSALMLTGCAAAVIAGVIILLKSKK